MLYRQAKYKEQQIEILCQLTGLREFEVERILEEGGYLYQMTDLIKDRISDLHGQGLNDSAIGRELGVAQSQVSKFLRSKGLPPNGRRKKKEDKKVEKKADYDVVSKLKEETQKNYEELKKILPTEIPDQDDLPINYVLPEVTRENIQECKTAESIETLTAQQYYELAKITLQLLKVMWEG